MSTTPTATVTTTTRIVTVRAAPVRLLVLPGLGGSGPAHWQTVWEASDLACSRVEQRDWERPQLDEWLDAADAAIGAVEAPVVLVAHSLACVLVAHGAGRPGWSRVAGALLVAPADVDSPAHTPPETRGFAPIPQRALPFPATVIASRNDPYVDLERARHLAGAWGATFVDAGEIGHINAASDLGDWPEGRRWLAELVARVREGRGGGS
jgi:predicted alpha/beta hydrolase family esterase